jgi:hypothetical protein
MTARADRGGGAPWRKLDDPMSWRAGWKTIPCAGRISNVNGVPIQNFYLREVVKGADGKPAIVTRGAIFEKHKDAYWEQCPANMRL